MLAPSAPRAGQAMHRLLRLLQLGCLAASCTRAFAGTVGEARELGQIRPGARGIKLQNAANVSGGALAAPPRGATASIGLASLNMTVFNDRLATHAGALVASQLTAESPPAFQMDVSPPAPANVQPTATLQQISLPVAERPEASGVWAAAPQTRTQPSQHAPQLVDLLAASAPSSTTAEQGCPPTPLGMGAGAGAGSCSLARYMTTMLLCSIQHPGRARAANSAAAGDAARATTAARARATAGSNCSGTLASETTKTHSGCDCMRITVTHGRSHCGCDYSLDSLHSWCAVRKGCSQNPNGHGGSLHGGGHGHAWDWCRQPNKSAPIAAPPKFRSASYMASGGSTSNPRGIPLYGGGATTAVASTTPAVLTIPVSLLRTAAPRTYTPVCAAAVSFLKSDCRCIKSAVSQKVRELALVSGVRGCTDSTAMNFAPSAAVDNSSCIYRQAGSSESRIAVSLQLAPYATLGQPTVSPLLMQQVLAAALGVNPVQIRALAIQSDAGPGSTITFTLQTPSLDYMNITVPIVRQRLSSLGDADATQLLETYPRARQANPGSTREKASAAQHSATFEHCACLPLVSRVSATSLCLR